MNNFLKDYGNGILLYEEEYQVLKKYGIDPKECKNMQSVIFKIEQVLFNLYNDDLDNVSKQLSERNYYQNTNK